jgi:hypothetical protein
MILKRSLTITEKEYTKAAEQETLPCGAEVRRVKYIVIDYDDNGNPIYCDEVEC